MPVFEILEQGKDINIILEKFEQYCIGEKNEIYERYRFNKRDQNEHETCVKSLHTLAKTYNFGQLVKNLIQDRAVTDIQDNTTRKKFYKLRNLASPSALICADHMRKPLNNLSP